MTYLAAQSIEEVRRLNGNLVTEQGQAAAKRANEEQVELAERMMEELISRGTPVPAQELFGLGGSEHDAREAMWGLINASYIRIGDNRSLELIPEGERTSRVGFY